MLKHFGTFISLSSSSSAPSLPIFNTGFPSHAFVLNFSTLSINGPKPARGSVPGPLVHARRRVISEEEEEEENGYNGEIAKLELYSQSTQDEALLVKALVDDEEVEVIIFKGFSSSLSYGTSPDPTKSVLPSRAKIKCIDRVKGPFNPSNIEYIERDISWEAFKTRLR